MGGGQGRSRWLWEVRTLTVEQIYQDRDQFAKLVREVAAPDVGRMGIEILSFTIKDVYDKVDYLSSLGKTQTAVVQRDADIGVAEAERDAGIREAECKKEMLDVKFMADTKIADSKRAFELQKSAFSEEVNIKTAEAQLAYELQGAREQQKIRQEEIEIEVVQRKKQIAVETQEILRTDKELIATVRRPAEAEAHRIQQIAEGEKVKQVLLAQAEAEKIRKIGEAEAAVIEAMGKAEAERMKLKAEAYQKYGDAAKMALVLEALPQIAAKISAPLTKVDEIVVLSGDNSKVTSEVNRLLAELPASVHALTGVDLSKVSGTGVLDVSMLVSAVYIHSRLQFLSARSKLPIFNASKSLIFSVVEHIAALKLGEEQFATSHIASETKEKEADCSIPVCWSSVTTEVGIKSSLITIEIEFGPKSWSYRQ
ncbi:flotillin 2 [Cricetulus griseus]